MIVRPRRWTRQPPQLTGLDRANDLTEGLLGAGYADVDAWGLPFTRTGTVSLVPGVAGMAVESSGSGNYLNTQRLYTPTTLNGTVMVCAMPVSLATTIGLLQTSTSSNFRGFHVTCSTAGVLTCAIGSAGTNATTNRRFWDITSYTAAVNKPFCLAYSVDSLTTARIYIDGVAQTSTAGGSMGTYAVGTGALTLLRRLGSNVFGNKQIFAWAVWDRTLSDDELSEVTTNPWQLFKAPSQIFWPSLPDGAATYDMPFTLSVGTSLGFSRNSSRYRTYSISTSGTPSSSQDSTMYLSETLNVGVSVDSSMGQRVEINESLGVGASPSLVKQVSKAFSVAAGAVVTSAQQLPITIVGGIRRGAKLLGSFFGRGSL